jgi:hypothetical protein
MSMKDTHDIASLHIAHKLMVDVVLSVATHGYSASLLIILLEIWSVTRKYAFNPPKVRFHPTKPKTFLSVGLRPSLVLQSISCRMQILILVDFSVSPIYSEGENQARLPPLESRNQIKSSFIESSKHVGRRRLNTGRTWTTGTLSGSSTC